MKEMEQDESDSGGGSESVQKMKPRERIGAIIRSDKVPYVVTLLLAGIAWSTTRIVDRVTQIPILEFCIREQSQGGERAVSCNVTNLCYKIFRDLNLYLTTEDAGTHIQRPEIAYIKPIMPNILKDKTPELEDETATYTLTELQPFCTASLRAAVKGSGLVSLRYNSSSTEPIRLVGWGLSTFIVRHEIGIYMGLVICWLVALVVYGFFLA